MPKNEQTGKAVGSTAGAMLNGRAMKQAIAWLRVEASDKDSDLAPLANTLLDFIDAARSIAGSALTQRPDKK